MLFGTHVVGGILAFVLDLSNAAFMLSLFVAPFEVAGRILDAQNGATAATATPNLTVFVAALAWTALFSMLVYLRYASLQVTR